MSAAVVPIRSTLPKRRKNCAQDGETISQRRLITSFQRAAFADDRDDTLETRTTALALSWAVERKLPCNNLRCIAGTLDVRRDLTVRIADVEIARADREAFHARQMRVLALHGSEAAQAMSEESNRLLERLWLATLDLANTPIFTQADLRRKRGAIGSVWLTAEGERYAPLRAAIDADKARLGGAA